MISLGPRQAQSPSRLCGAWDTLMRRSVQTIGGQCFVTLKWAADAAVRHIGCSSCVWKPQSRENSAENHRIVVPSGWRHVRQQQSKGMNGTHIVRQWAVSGSPPAGGQTSMIIHKTSITTSAYSVCHSISAPKSGPDAGCAPSRHPPCCPLACATGDRYHLSEDRPSL